MTTATLSEVLEYHLRDTGSPAEIERVTNRRLKMPLTIVEPDPSWPDRYAEMEESIRNAVSDVIISIAHTGSTSVPHLPAKPVIDVDLVVKDIFDEPSYIPQLESAGYLLLHREPLWNQHRFLVHDREDMFPVNLHVWPQRCPEVERHRIFRDWLKKTPGDVEIYAQAKRQAAATTVAHGGDMEYYNARKNAAVQEILKRALEDERKRVEDAEQRNGHA